MVLMPIFPFAGAVQTPQKNELEYSQALQMCTDTLGKFGTATFCKRQVLAIMPAIS